MNPAGSTELKIATAVEQQTVVSDEIGHNVTSICDITSQNSSIAHENAQATSAVSDQAKSLEQAIALYKVYTQTISTCEIQSFLWANNSSEICEGMVYHFKHILR
ncbi:MAG: iron uptake system EfeUOB component EfeO/EfeM [Moritella sp.]